MAGLYTPYRHGTPLSWIGTWAFVAKRVGIWRVVCLLQEVAPRSKAPPPRSADRRKPQGNSQPGLHPSTLEGFGRAQLEAGEVASDFGCPDCSGTLYVREAGDQGWLSFRCRIGHVFAIDSLLQFKEDRLDEAFWTALEHLDELAQLYAVMGAWKRELPGVPAREQLAARRRRILAHRRALRALIRTEGVVSQHDREGNAR